MRASLILYIKYVCLRQLRGTLPSIVVGSVSVSLLLLVNYGKAMRIKYSIGTFTFGSFKRAKFCASSVTSPPCPPSCQTREDKMKRKRLYYNVYFQQLQMVHVLLLAAWVLPRVLPRVRYGKALSGKKGKTYPYVHLWGVLKGQGLCVLRSGIQHHIIFLGTY